MGKAVTASRIPIGKERDLLIFTHYLLSKDTGGKVKAPIKGMSLKRAKFYFAGTGIAGLLVVLVILALNFSVREQTAPVPEIAEKTRDADMHLDKIHYTSTNDQGVTEWELKASTANYFKGNKVAEFEDVDIIFYSEKERTFTVRGDTGILNTETRDVELSGNVIGTSSDGYRFQTEFLSYEAAKQQARTDKKVLLESPQFNLEGWGMVMDMEKEKVFLLNDVRALGKK
jgi:LPS export ABC transporter protein LptC